MGTARTDITDVKIDIWVSCCFKQQCYRRFCPPIFSKKVSEDGKISINVQQRKFFY